MSHNLLDISDEMTVFMITVGGVTAPNCAAALKAQNCLFKLVTIANVAPMSAAFQQMLDTCTTPYFVQVDEDMVLRREAISRLHTAAKAMSGNIAFVCYGLWDTHIEMPIIGVKCYRHDICKMFPYKDEQACEMGQLERMAAAGYKYIATLPQNYNSPDILGSHVSCKTPWQAYDRYKDLIEKHRRHHQCPWIEALPAKFAKRLGVNINHPDLWALFGMIAGSTSTLDSVAGEKDFRKYELDPAFVAMKNMLQKPVK